MVVILQMICMKRVAMNLETHHKPRCSSRVVESGSPRLWVRVYCISGRLVGSWQSIWIKQAVEGSALAKADLAKEGAEGKCHVQNMVQWKKPTPDGIINLCR